jgi:hypothetical protein
MQNTSHTITNTQRTSRSIPSTTINNKLRRLIKRTTILQAKRTRLLTSRNINQSPKHTSNSIDTSRIKHSADSKVLYRHQRRPLLRIIARRTSNTKITTKNTRIRRNSVVEHYILNVPSTFCSDNSSTRTKEATHVPLWSGRPA